MIILSYDSGVRGLRGYYKELPGVYGDDLFLSHWSQVSAWAALLPLALTGRLTLEKSHNQSELSCPHLENDRNNAYLAERIKQMENAQHNILALNIYKKPTSPFPC